MEDGLIKGKGKKESSGLVPCHLLVSILSLPPGFYFLALAFRSSIHAWGERNLL
jgi:hypothetical protein